MDPSFNYYQLLHVQPDAPEAVIKASYRTMMQKLRHHPDLGGDEATAQRLNEAVAVLCQPDKRKRYDLELMLHREFKQSTTTRTPREASPKTEPTRQETPQEAQQDNHQDNQRRAQQDTQRGTVTTTALPGQPQCAFCHARRLQVTFQSQHYNNNRCARCGGATTPIHQIDKSSDGELRKIYRHAHAARVMLWENWPLDNPIEATLNDLSPVGCSLSSPAQLSISHVLLLDTDTVNAVCVVRYCQKNTLDPVYEVGLEFLTLRVEAQPGSLLSISA